MSKPRTRTAGHASNLAILQATQAQARANPSPEVLDDDEQDLEEEEDVDDDDDDDHDYDDDDLVDEDDPDAEFTDAELARALEIVRQQRGMPQAMTAPPAPAPAPQAAVPQPPQTAIQVAQPNAVQRLQAEVAAGPADPGRPATTTPVHPGMPVAAPASAAPSLDSYLTNLCHSQGDVVVAEQIWTWVAKRRAELGMAGLHGLAARWDMVQHALSSAGGFTRGEWGPK